MRKPHSNARFVKRFASDEQGGVILMFVAGIIFLLAIGGAAVDLGLQQLQRLKLQNSVDAAATSAASLVACAQKISPGDRQAAAERYFNLNYPERFVEKTARPIPQIGVVDSTPSAAGRVTVSARDSVQTHFVNNFAIPKLNSSVSSAAQISDAINDTNFDAVMVIDETGSMRGGLEYVVFDPSGGHPAPPYPPFEQSRAAAAQRAFQTFVTNLFPDCAVSNPNVRVGMVGFAGFVTNKWALSSNRAYAQGLSANIRPIGRNMEEIGLRAGTNMLMEQPGADKEIPTWNASTAPKDDWYGSGPAGYYFPASYVLPPAQVGVSERRSLLHPTPPPGPYSYDGEGFLDLSIDYDTRVPLPATAREKPPQFRHMVLMSDGTIATDASTGFRNTSAMEAECARAKSMGVTVHTINFTSQDDSDRDVLTRCASTPANYHYAPTEEELNNILSLIGSTIHKTRIVQ